jgi:hypothetical protein
VYVIVHQQQRRVERHWRDAVADPWQVAVITSGPVPISGIGFDLPIDTIYAGGNSRANVISA